MPFTRCSKHPGERKRVKGRQDALPPPFEVSAHLAGRSNVVAVGLRRRPSRKHRPVQVVPERPMPAVAVRASRVDVLGSQPPGIEEARRIPQNGRLPVHGSVRVPPPRSGSGLRRDCNDVLQESTSQRRVLEETHRSAVHVHAVRPPLVQPLSTQQRPKVAKEEEVHVRVDAAVGVQYQRSEKVALQPVHVVLRRDKRLRDRTRLERAHDFCAVELPELHVGMVHERCDERILAQVHARPGPDPQLGVLQVLR
mmetsp:Transcript_34718/g.72812  ORF Transcript_34718/g.72812 Transcript_34718/m.72812 type:complete len:253 (+) Transcript_34718:1248-2006(+)